MVSQIPLYPRGNPLKNLISRWKNEYRNTDGQLIVEWDYGLAEPIKVELSVEEKMLYDAFVEYWYFADIGFDTDNEFVYRLNAVWKSEISKYLSLISIEAKAGLGGDYKELEETHTKTGVDTVLKQGTKSTSITVDCSETAEKGVTTTSSQQTNNEGDKLARTTPNEKLSVTGTSTTTVSDSGADNTTRSETRTSTETPNYEDTYNFNNTTSNTAKEKLVKLSADEYKKLLSVRSILKDFVLCFEKLFLEVFD